MDTKDYSMDIVDMQTLVRAIELLRENTLTPVEGLEQNLQARIDLLVKYLLVLVREAEEREQMYYRTDVWATLGRVAHAATLGEKVELLFGLRYTVKKLSEEPASDKSSDA